MSNSSFSDNQVAVAPRWACHDPSICGALRPLDHGVIAILLAVQIVTRGRAVTWQMVSDVVSLSVDAVEELKLDGIPYSFSSNFLCSSPLCLRVR